MSNSSLRKIMLRVNKTFSESRSLKGLADGGGPVFVTSETRKRLSADQRRENAETWVLYFPNKWRRHVWFVYAREAAEGRRGPRYT